MADGKSKKGWNEVAKAISEKNPKEMVKLIKDLYSLSHENRNFVNARCLSGSEQLNPYKAIIEKSLYPDVYEKQTINLSAGKKAISDYKKAIGDLVGTLELMVFYVECGNNFTIDFGDICDSFYSSLESMFNRIVTLLKKSDESVNKMFQPRLRDIVDKAKEKGIGWGYTDFLRNAFAEAFPENGN